MNYDPDRDLWLPSRRKFFFLGLAAGVAPFLPDVPLYPAGTVLTFDIAREAPREIRAMVLPNGSSIAFEYPLVVGYVSTLSLNGKDGRIVGHTVDFSG